MQMKRNSLALQWKSFNPCIFLHLHSLSSTESKVVRKGRGSKHRRERKQELEREQNWEPRPMPKIQVWLGVRETGKRDRGPHKEENKVRCLSIFSNVTSLDTRGNHPHTTILSTSLKFSSCGRLRDLFIETYCQDCQENGERNFKFLLQR